MDRELTVPPLPGSESAVPLRAPAAGSSGAAALPGPVPLRISQRFSLFWIGGLAFLVGFLARQLLTPFLGTSIPYMLFFPCIIVSAWYGGRGAGFLTTILSAFSALHLLQRTHGSVSTPAAVGWMMFLCTGTFISWLNDAFRKSEYQAKNELAARMKYEEALRKSEERLTLALEAAGGVATWDWDISKDCFVGDAQFAKLFSLPVERALEGVPLSDFLARIHPDDRALTKQKIDEAVRSGLDYQAEYRIEQPGQSLRWIYTRGRPQHDASGRAFRFPGVVFDVTDRRHSEDALRNANRYLEEFAYVASHDLQEPLRIVNIYTELILRRLGRQDEQLNEFASYVHNGIDRMQRLIRDLLTFSRTLHTNEVPLGRADLAASLAEALSLLKTQIAECQALITSDPLPVVTGDEHQIAHVFQNLISNSLKYAKADAHPVIGISAQDAGGQWIISVRDAGIGFESQYADRIFGLFKRLHKDEYPGTGLGLAICQRIVERHGGRIWAESEPGQGATFHFSFPHTPGERAPETAG